MQAYQVKELFGAKDGDDLDFYFHFKKDAIKHIAKRIKQMDENDEADLYSEPMFSRLDRWHKEKQWEKLASYYRLYLTKIEIH